MKHKLLELRDPLGIIFIFVVAIFFIVNLSSCGGGYIFSPFESIDDGTLEGADDGTVADDTPAEIVPGDDPGSLVPGDQDGNDDGWVPPDPGDQQDSDGDGYPDDIDYLDDMVIYLCVASYDVSSAEIKLNGDVIFGTNSFDNTTWVRCRVINPMAQGNTLTSGYTINGSPGDKVAISVKEWDPDAGQFIRTFFEDEIVRETGTPVEYSSEFDIL